MATISFDTQKFVRRLREAGMSDAQAEVATKYDLRELEYRLVIKLGAMVLAAVGAVATLVKIL
jgi:hypothetical protein